MRDISIDLDRFILSFFMLFVLTFSGASLAEEDPYLKALEAESDFNSVDGGNAPKVSDQPDVSGTQPPQKKQFEAVLYSERPTTYKTYLLLGEEEKSKVIEAYFSSDKDIEKTSRLIFDLYYK